MIFGLEEAIANDVATMMGMEPLLPFYLRHSQRDAVSRFKPNKLEGDFLMLTEFTDDIGPEPLTDYIIPRREEIEVNGFDLDQFAINIMSADYFAQTNARDQSFRMPEDIHALISNSHSGFYTLLYAFTLYDIQGRGYVRPVYLSYTSRHREKIIHHYEQLTQAIATAVQNLIQSNIRLFAKELEVYIREFRDLYCSSAMVSAEAERLAYIEEVFHCVTKRLNFNVSEFEMIAERSGTHRRQITEISENWLQFGRDLHAIHKRFSQSYSQINMSLKDELIAGDTFHCLKIGDSSLASLTIHDENKQKAGQSERKWTNHKESTASIASGVTYSSDHSCMSAPSSPTSADPHSAPASFTSYSSDFGANSLTSDKDRAGSLTSGCSWVEVDKPETDVENSLYNDSLCTLKADQESISTDSLLSRTDQEETTKSLIDPSFHYASSLYPGLTELITEHKLYVQNLIYSVLISNPVVLVSTEESKARSAAETLCSFIPGSRKQINPDGKNYVVKYDWITFKNIFRHPITCLVTSERFSKIASNLRDYATLYDLNSKTYEGPIYKSDTQPKSKLMLDLFYRKKKHKQPYYSSLVKSLMMDMACKAKLLHSFLRSKTRVEQSELLELLDLKCTLDLNIVKNLVHIVVQQQYTSFHGVKLEDISSVCLMLTLS